MSPARPSVAVGMSGGVDSTVAALLLRDAGHDVLGVFLRLWPGDDPRSCCSPVAERRAADAADHLGIPFSVLDLRDEFERRVVRPFVAAYLSGITPNPCVACNPFRFRRLHEWAAAHGAAAISSGHYAASEWRDGQPWVARGRDAGKDQSYMLAEVPPETLSAMLLPLGKSTKREVRERARAAGLAAADQQESQEVCFACDGYRGFLRERGIRPQAGDIVDEAGRRIGRHQGHWEFTVGQRRGLGVAAAQPLFVTERRAAENQVVVGPRESLQARVVALVGVDERGWSWLTAGRAPGGRRSEAGRAGLAVQLRYRSPAVLVDAVRLEGDRRLLVELETPFEAAAAGQIGVLYEGRLVRAVGTIAVAAGRSAEGLPPAAETGRRGSAAGSPPPVART
jgi:tRNA-specific 2-thiouridylase